MAGTERVKLLGKFFSYHATDEIYVRRLVLCLPPPMTHTSGKRQRQDPCPQARKEQVMHVCGASFGATLGSICAYLEGRGVPAERAYVLRSIRTQLLPVAEALRSMRGADVPHLSRGLDSKYGNAHTCIGATATLLCCFGTMATVPDHARHFVADSSIIKALRCAHEALEFWKVSSTHMTDTHWAALASEKRAIARAVAGARCAAREAARRALDPTASVLLQLQWAREAAFPSNQLVSEFSQARLMEQIQRQELFTNKMPGPSWPPCAPMTSFATAALLVDVVPLSQISEGDLTRNKRRKRVLEDDESVGSSSWASASSVASSFSHVSADSLGELVEPFRHAGV